MKVNQIIDEMQASLTKLRGHYRKTGTAGEYQGPKHEVIPPMQMDYSNTEIHSNFPLNAKVAKAIGRKPWQYADGRWFFHSRSDSTWESMLIPNYPNDLVAAMGAFQEYAKKNRHLNLHVYPQMGGSSWCIDMDDCGIQPCGKNLATLICEAIVAHAEGK